MFEALWKALRPPALYGAILFSVVSLSQAQQEAPPLSSPGAPNVTLVVPAPVHFAGPANVPADPIAELKARIERLEKQNHDLLDVLKNLNKLPTSVPASFETSQGGTGNGLNTNDVQKIVGDYLGVREAQVKASEAAVKADLEAKGYTVGGNVGLTGGWKHNQYWFETADKSFRLHIGGRTQFDIVGVDAPANVQFGPGGIGSYQDGVNFRRARFAMEGTFWEVFDFNCEIDFINTTQAVNGVNFTNRTTTNNTFNTPAPTDMWVQLTHIPLLGTLRIGNQKPWISFEHLTSSRYLNFLERSYQFDSFIEDGNNGFSPGISVFNNWGPDQNGMWAAGLFKTTRSIFGWNTGDGEWAGVARGTWLPVYEHNGRRLVHLGMGAQFRDLDDAAIRLRSRTLTRQAPAALHNISAIAQTNGTTQLLLNPEFVVNYGPFTLQSEYTYSEVHGVTNVIRTPTQTNAAIAKQTFKSQGFYVEGLCFLTGEHRLYDKKSGAFGRVIPNRNFYFVKGEANRHLFQSGAWQVGLRYSYVDLNDGPIRGGQLNDCTVGLNWFLNPNFKIQGNYSYGYRTVDAASNGAYQGLGVRFAFDW